MIPTIPTQFCQASVFNIDQILVFSKISQHKLIEFHFDESWFVNIL